VAVQFTSEVCGRLVTGIAVSNTAEGVDICLLCFYVVFCRPLQPTGHSSRGVLPCVSKCVRLRKSVQRRTRLKYGL
jgi:hypothetical protein